MATKRKTKTKTIELPAWAKVLFAVIFFVLGFFFGDRITEQGGGIFGGRVGQLIDGAPALHFVDVGQGDCLLITYNGDAVLVDAGPVSSGKAAAEYVKNYVDTIDYFIITHPHEDHMGGAAAILEAIEVENIIMPERDVAMKFYTNAMDMIEEQNINVIYSEPHAVFDTGNIKITIIDSLIPGEDDLNNISIVARIDVGSTSIMTTGDAEVEAEMQILENYIYPGGLYDPSILDCDILKVGHHGSRTSTTSEFLNLVSPQIAVISCGEGNSYGHPHEETMEVLKQYNLELHRTDLEGTVIISGEP